MKDAGGLATRNCADCAGARALGDDPIQQYLSQIPGWERRGGEIARQFHFKNYFETMAFVNASAWISHRQDHHPDLEVGYNTCLVRYSTHSAGGITESDFICAAKIDALFAL